MAVNVYAWPPVGVKVAEWTREQPISAGRSGLTGARYVSSRERERRFATLHVSALSRGSNGAGYVEVLKRLLEGGENLIRLTSYPVNWHLHHLAEAGARQSTPVDWTDGGVDAEWTDGGTATLWYEGTVLSGSPTTSGGFPAVALSGLAPNAMVARPGEFLTVFDGDLSANPETRQIMAPAYSNGSGAATIRIVTAITNTGRVNLGSSETAVFEVDLPLPRSPQPIGRDWVYPWSFREVFADEVTGGFAEVPGWWEAT